MTTATTVHSATPFSSNFELPASNFFPPPNSPAARSKTLRHVFDNITNAGSHLDDLLKDLDLSPEEAQQLLATQTFRTHRQLRTELLSLQLQIAAQDHARLALERLNELAHSRHPAVARLAATQILTYAGLTPPPIPPAQLPPSPASVLNPNRNPSPSSPTPTPPNITATTPPAPFPNQNSKIENRKSPSNPQPLSPNPSLAQKIFLRSAFIFLLSLLPLCPPRPIRYNSAMNTIAHQQCMNADCSATYDVAQTLTGCPKCGDLLDIQYNWSKAPVPKRLKDFEQRWQNRRFPLDHSGVWRFRDLLPFAADAMICTIGEGQTFLQNAQCLGRQLGMWPGQLYLQYEGMNPSGSFKDNGMTAAFTHARMVGARRVACASTGNTSASLALYAAQNGFQGIVFIGTGKIAFGKLSQALDYGALTLQIEGDFDACLRRVREVSAQLGLYLMNSVNPFRLEGQKSIMYRILEGLSWEVPDWIIVPGGNLGNCSAFGKAYAELLHLGLVKKVPRLAIINASGANTLHHLVSKKNLAWNHGRPDMSSAKGLYASMDESNYHPHTVASAIEISRPVNLKKSLRALDVMHGVTHEVTDHQILEAKALVGRYGFGCEPASAATIAGLIDLLANGTISRSERVACILTGHGLKDPDATVYYHTGTKTKDAIQPAAEPTWGKLANKPIKVADDMKSILAALGMAQDSLEKVAGKGYVESPSSHYPFVEY